MSILIKVYGEGDDVSTLDFVGIKENVGECGMSGIVRSWGWEELMHGYAIVKQITPVPDAE